MPSYGGESDSGYGGWGQSQVGGFSSGDSFGGGGLDGAPDIGALGGNYADSYGETSATYGGETSPEQSGVNGEVNTSPWGYDFNAAGMQAPDEFSLGQMFGYNQQQGLPTNEGEFSGNVNNYGFSDFAQSPFGKTLRGLLGMTPFGKVANIGIGAALGESPAKLAASAVTGQLGNLARAGVAAYGSKNPAESLGRSALGYGLGTLGSTVGSGIGGPIGGLLGGMAGSRMAGLSGGPSNTSTNSGGFNVGGAIQGLGGLYAGYRGMKQAGQLQDNATATNQALQGQMGSLAGMYAPDSPYAKQLAQQLARKDAAAGRNSQYGPRAVELQARLAALAPTVANSMSNLAGSAGTSNAQAQAAQNAKQQAQAQMLNKLIGAGQATGFNDWAGRGLSSLFSNNTAAPMEYNTSEWG